MTGNDAKYINVHGKGVQKQNDRDIILSGDNAQYVDVTLEDGTREEYAIDK